MFEVRIEKRASDFIKKLGQSIQNRIIKKFKDLSVNPQLGKPLTSSLSGLWSLRIGDYRALYQIKNKELIVLVLKVGHRKNIYD